MALHHRQSLASLTAIENALSSLRISQQASSPSNIRHASHQAQGRANKAKDGPGKRLGAKKSGEQYVIPGNILFRQRGTHWFPGENAMMGRDHTIHAAAPGFVKYYRDPARHPKRQYIGIVFNRNDTLPTPPNAARRRLLGMVAYKMPPTADLEVEKFGDLITGQSTGMPGNAEMGSGQPSTIREVPVEARGKTVLKNKKGEVERVIPTLRPGYQYRQANWEIGRAAERSAAALKVKPFKPRDRFAAWRKANVRKAKNAERRSMGRGGKKK